MDEKHVMPHHNDSDEINLLDYLIVILKHKSFIVKTTLGAMTLAAAISLLLPKYYRAETKILPPNKTGTSMASFFTNQMGGMGINPGILGIKSSASLYKEFLKTRPVLDYVIKKLDLMKYYDVGKKYIARKLLKGNLMLSEDRKSGIVTVAYVDRNPEMAAKIVDAFVEGLDELNNNLAVTEAAQRRLFFEKQLSTAKEELVKAEEDLKNFQQKTGTIKVDSEAEAAIETASKLRAEISAKEVEMRVMRNYATEQNPDLQKLKEEVSALKEQLRKFESKSPSDSALFSTKKISVLGTQYLRKMREFKYRESLYEILLRQYEAARLDESRDAGVIQIVEKAEPPEMRFKPQRKKIVVNTGLVVFFLSVFFVFMKVWWENLKNDPQNRERIKVLKDNISEIKTVLAKIKK